MAQLQCDNCGGYKVDEVKRTLSINRETGEHGPFSGMAVGFFLAIACFFLGFVLVQQAAVWFFVLDGVSLAIIIGTMMYYASKFHQVKFHYYTCQLCGFKWETREDRPETQAENTIADPDLIKLGAKHLEQQ